MTFPVYHETRHPAEFVINEEEAGYAREVITVAAGAGVLAAGSVMGEVTATSKYLISAKGAADGSQNANAVILYPVDATTADVQVAAIVRGPAVLNGNTLTYAADRTTAVDKAAANTGLLAAGIVVRN